MKTFSYLSLLFFCCTFVCGDTSNTQISDILNWKHPTKMVFEEYGVEIKRVVLVNKTYPEYYISLPYKTQKHSKSEFEVFLKKVAHENAYWDFVLIGNTDIKIEIRVICNKTDKIVKEIKYISGRDIFSDKEFSYFRSMVTPNGPIHFFSSTLSMDSTAYRITGKNNSIDFSAENTIIDGLKLLLSKDQTSFVLASFTVPGLNCHECYRIIEVTAKTIQGLSNQFGKCYEIQSASIAKDTVVLKLKSVTDNGLVSEIRWINGVLIEK